MAIWTPMRIAAIGGPGALVVGWKAMSMSGRKATVDQTVVPGLAVVLTPSTPKTPAPGDRATRVFVVLTMSGHQPARSGRVEVLVRAVKGGGGERSEIGRFAIFPSESFTPAMPDKTRQDRFEIKNCTPDDVLGGRCRIEVELAPVGGTGEGASLIVARSEFEFR